MVVFDPPVGHGGSGQIVQVKPPIVANHDGVSEHHDLPDVAAQLSGTLAPPPEASQIGAAVGGDSVDAQLSEVDHEPDTVVKEGVADRQHFGEQPAVGGRGLQRVSAGRIGPLASNGFAGTVRGTAGGECQPGGASDPPRGAAGVKAAERRPAEAASPRPAEATSPRPCEVICRVRRAVLYHL